MKEIYIWTIKHKSCYLKFLDPDLALRAGDRWLVAAAATVVPAPILATDGKIIIVFFSLSTSSW